MNSQEEEQAITKRIVNTLRKYSRIAAKSLEIKDKEKLDSEKIPERKTQTELEKRPSIPLIDASKQCVNMLRDKK